MRNFVLTALVSLMSFAAQAAELGTHHTMMIDGLEREYYLFVPPKAGAAPRPLVVVLHGGGGKPISAARMSGFSELAARENFLVAYPAGTGRLPTWNAGTCCGYAERNNIDDVAFIRAMVEEIQENQKIDPIRIYATGMSNGGMMAYRLACEMGDVFNAVAPVAGAMNTQQCQPEGRPSLIIFHAVDDMHVLYEGGESKQGLRTLFGKTPEPDTSVGDAMRFWLQHDYCRNIPDISHYEEYQITNYFCAENREVRLVALKAGGHSWPGGEKGREQADEPVQSMSATEMMWEFFKMHPAREVF